MKKSIIASLDIGTTKTCAIIAEKVSDNNFNILGFGVAPSEGMLRGNVANKSKTAEAIRKAVDIAENQAGFKVNSVNIGVAGIHIRSMRIRNYVTINNLEKEVSEKDLEKLMNDIKLTRIPADYKILHILPEEFIVDNLTGIKNPVGISGTKLEAATHVVLAQITALESLKDAVERAGLRVNHTILQPIASSRAVLDKSEKELGVVIIDIGGGTTDIACYVNNSVSYTNVMGIAGSQVTSDLRSAFNIVSDYAEKLKIEYGYAYPKSIVEDLEIAIQHGGARPPTNIHLSVLSQVIYLRMKELFLLIDYELTKSKLKDKAKCGIVLTGGGSLIKGCDILAQEVFGLQCRIGIPMDIGGGLSQHIENPVFSTAVGLLHGSIDKSENNDDVNYASPKKAKNKPIFSIFNNVKKFFDEL